MDKTLGKELMKILKKEGFKFLFNHAVQKVNAVEGGVQLDVKNKKEEIISIEGDYCLVAVGRKAFTKNSSSCRSEMCTFLCIFFSVSFASSICVWATEPY